MGSAKPSTTSWQWLQHRLESVRVASGLLHISHLTAVCVRALASRPRAACLGLVAPTARSISHWAWSRAWLLLGLAALLWGGNGVAARIAVDQISPMVLVSLRWLIIFLVLVLVMPDRIRAALPVLWERRRLVLAMATFGLTGFNFLLYSSAHWASAIDIMLLQSLIPVLVLAGAVWSGERAHPTEIGGIAVTCLGVATIATQGHPLALSTLSVNKGGVMVLLACFLAAWYTLSLRRRPSIAPVVFFAALALAAFLASLPLLAWEIARGDAYMPTSVGWAVMLFTAVGPALCAQVFYLRGVELIGPARAGPYNNLVPIFGALLGVGLLGEAFELHHAAGLLLVVSGLAMCERKLLSPAWLRLELSEDETSEPFGAYLRSLGVTP